MFKFSISGIDDLRYIMKNITLLPEKIKIAVETSDLQPDIKAKLLEAVKTMKITGKGIEMENPEIMPNVNAIQLLKMLQFGSATLGIKPQLQLKNLILE